MSKLPSRLKVEGVFEWYDELAGLQDLALLLDDLTDERLNHGDRVLLRLDFFALGERAVELACRRRHRSRSIIVVFNFSGLGEDLSGVHDQNSPDESHQLVLVLERVVA